MCCGLASTACTPAKRKPQVDIVTIIDSVSGDLPSYPGSKGMCYMSYMEILFMYASTVYVQRHNLEY